MPDEEVSSKKSVMMSWMKYIAPALIAALSSGTLSVSQSSSNNTDLHTAYDTLRKSHNELLEEYKRDHDILVSLSGAVKTLSWIMLPNKSAGSINPIAGSTRRPNRPVVGSGFGRGAGGLVHIDTPPVAAAMVAAPANVAPPLPEILDKVRNLPDQVEVKAEPAPAPTF